MCFVKKKKKKSRRRNEESVPGAGMSGLNNTFVGWAGKGQGGRKWEGTREEKGKGLEEGEESFLIIFF